MENVTNRIPDYIVYPTKFRTYKWWKPILVAILTGVFYFLGSIVNTIVVFVIELLCGSRTSVLSILMIKGYDGFNVYTAPGAIATEGSVVWLMVALILAVNIVKDRPFSSYSSSSGNGWSWGIFTKCFLLALVICGIPIAANNILIDGRIGPQQFTLAGLILCTILGPLQCVAEEYIFRGLFMQTFGSWFKVPIVAIVLQTMVFASAHPYNFVGVLEIYVVGIGLGIIAWLAKGLESSCAYHIVNNMTLFYLTGFGFGEIKTQVGWRDFLLTFACIVVYILVLDKMSKKGKLR
ncbi:MAG: CPBP family intramembrane metalloprotease [Firmicutes bacterium]|nr:CPBP family intramembrane metalloprotease [Bacillota bacterium]